MPFIMKNSVTLMLLLLVALTGVSSFVAPPPPSREFANVGCCQHGSLVSPASLLSSSGKNGNAAVGYIDAKYVAHHATEPGRKRKKTSTSKQPKIESNAEYLDADFFMPDDSDNTAEGDESQSAAETPEHEIGGILHNEFDAENEAVAKTSSSSSSPEVKEQPVESDSATILVESTVTAEAKQEESSQEKDEKTSPVPTPIEVVADNFSGATVVQAKTSSMYRKPVTGRQTKPKDTSTTTAAPAAAPAPIQMFADDFIGASAVQVKASSMYRIAVGKTRKVASSSAAARGPVQADDFFGSNIATSTRAHAASVKGDSKDKKKKMKTTMPTARKKDSATTMTPNPVSADDFFGRNVAASKRPTKSTYAGATTKKVKKQTAEKLATSAHGAPRQIPADDFFGATTIQSRASDIYRSYPVKKAGLFATDKSASSAATVRMNDFNVAVASAPKSSSSSNKIPAAVKKKKKTASSVASSATASYQIPADDFFGATVVQSKASNIYHYPVKGNGVGKKEKKVTRSPSADADSQHQVPVDDFFGHNVSSSQRTTESGTLKTYAGTKEASTNEQVTTSSSPHLNDFLGSTSFAFSKQRVYL